MFAQVREVVFVPEPGDLCRRPYPGHPKGCPNYGKRSTCPPQAPVLHQVLNFAEPVFAIWNRFDFAGHVAAMKAKHPDWSQRQLECCLYWQPRARKQLQAAIDEFRRIRPLSVVRIPEACGVNVTETMKLVGVELEWPPRISAYQVALAGTPLRVTEVS